MIYYKLLIFKIINKFKACFCSDEEDEAFFCHHGDPKYNKIDDNE